MKELLYIETSPRKARSASTEVAGAFIDEVRRMHPQCRLTTLNPWTMDLPELSQDMLDAKYAGINGVPLTAAQQTAWDQVRRIAAPFHTADHIVLAVPLWNFGIPYKLKQLIDVVSQPGLVFGFDPDLGYSGLLAGKRATAIYTSAVYGDDRPPAFGVDFQAPYFDSWLEWAGITEHDSIFFRPNLATADAEPARQAALARARLLGAGQYDEVSRAS